MQCAFVRRNSTEMLRMLMPLSLTQMILSDIMNQTLPLCDFSIYVFTGVQRGAGEESTQKPNSVVLTEVTCKN